VTDIDLRDEPYDAPVAASLVDAVQQEYVERYGGPDDSPVQPDEFAPPHGRFLVGYVGTTPVAMGGLRRIDATTVEIKRMYVRPAARRTGLGRALLDALEAQARAAGAERVVLETGTEQHEAAGLYEAAGYLTHAAT